MPRRAAAVLAVALVLGAAVVWSMPRVAIGDHGGREISSLFTCDQPVVPPRCTSVGDNGRHRVVFDDSLTDGLAASLREAMAEAYDRPTKLTMVEQPRLTRATDAIAYSDDYGENGAAGWVYCPLDSPQGVNLVGHRWCRQQEIHFNINARYGLFFADDASRDHVTCHELGHTLGLKHWGNPPQTDGIEVGATCMNANNPDGPTRLHPFDIDHINAYPYRTVPLPTRASLTQSPPQLLPWRGVVATTQVESLPATLDAMLARADAVVLGEIVAVVPGRVFGERHDRPLHYASATLEVSEMIAGGLPPAHRSSLTLEIPLFDGPSSIADLPVWGEAVFVLRNKGVSAREAGLSPARIGAESPYYRLLTFTALVVNDHGVAFAAGDAGPLAALSGRRFEAAVEALRTVAR